MKVLILHQHFKTPNGGGAIRSYYLGRALAESGIHAVVITAHNDPGYITKNVDGIEVHYAPVPYDNRFGFYKRILSFYRFVNKAVRLAAQHRDADVCYAISTPLTTGLAARAIRRKYNIPYVFEVGDLWPDAPVEMGFIRNPLIKALLFRMERAIYSAAVSIVALSDPIRTAILRRAPGKPVHVVPNMADTSFYRPEERKPEIERKLGVSGKFVVSYIGALGVANGLHSLLDCAAACQQHQLAIHFLVCGDGAMADHLKNYAAKIGLMNLTFIPFQNRDGVGEIMNVTDANFVSYLPAKILETGSPNKYFDGLAAGKLTIINFGGWIKTEIEGEGCGIYVSHAQDFAKKIKPFLDNPRLLSQYQRAARELAERKYSRTDLGKRFASIVTEAHSVKH